ncbi:hypothetical protein V7S43_009310 [Phytophthora oleae]|uniref:SMP-LTD domain-containing protein n=2 Tax=Phytophthora oleae TaxID=2107226 RepID=A0ABD3FJY9_9STRA
MSLSPPESTAEVSTVSQSQTAPNLPCSEAAAAAEDKVQRSVKIPTTARNTSSLDHDSVEGLMLVHRKKKQRQRFMLSKSTHYVVANTLKHALEIYNNESRTELVYLLSLADAVLSFESDNSNIVMEKCFCVEVRTWKKKNTVRLQPQGFIFFEENQARMLLWVKCIHLAIKRATTLDSELFRCPSTASSIEHSRRFSDSDESRETIGAAIPAIGVSSEDSQCASTVTSPSTSPTASSAFASAREKLTQRLVIDPANRIVTVGRTMLTPTRSSSGNGERQNRWSAMFSHDKHQQTRSPTSSTCNATDPPSSPSETCSASPKSSSWARRSTKVATDVSLDVASSQNPDPVSSLRSRSLRTKSPALTPSKNDAVSTGKRVEKQPVQLVTSNSVPSEPLAVQPKRQDGSTEEEDDLEPVAALVPTLMLTVAIVAGVWNTSVFLPLALAGSLAHFYNQHASYSSWTLSSVAVYVASSNHVLFGIGTASVFLYFWGYSNYKEGRRRRLQLNAVNRFRVSQKNHATAENIPTWMRYPDVDRVEWLNKVFVTGWPYLKRAIENSVLGSLNPVLDAQKPAFMNSLTLIRLNLGNKTPQIASVKFISANALTDEVTLDVEVRVVTDKKSFIADLRMVSHLGASACLSLRELLLVGTLRITLNPLAEYWPCFGGLSLCFTE